MGNPSFYACWRDEALNYVLRTLAEHAHRTTFYMRIHQSFCIVGSMRLNNFIFGDESVPELEDVTGTGNSDAEHMALENALLDIGH